VLVVVVEEEEGKSDEEGKGDEEMLSKKRPARIKMNVLNELMEDATNMTASVCR